MNGIKKSYEYMPSKTRFRESTHNLYAKQSRCWIAVLDGNGRAFNFWQS